MGLANSGGRLSVLPATWRDYRQVLALERVCFNEDAWPWIDILGALTFPDTVRLKAELDGRVVGFAVGDLRRREDLGWIATIGVHPDFRRRGIGRRLLLACEEALGTGRIRLTLRLSNLEARQLYERNGYVEIDRLERYYRDGEGAYVMEKIRVPAEAAEAEKPAP